MKIESCPKCGRRGEVSRHGERGMYCVMCFTRTQLCDNAKSVHAHTKIGASLRWNRWARREKRKMERSGKK